jgi:uncharacterized membrane protein
MSEDRDWVPRLLWVAIAFAALWVLVVLLSGLGINFWGREWSFEATGLLGDSFGVVSAVMTSLAAIFAFRTYRQARHEIEEQRKQSAETSYLNLLERRYALVDQLSSVHGMVREGHEVIEHMATQVRDRHSDMGLELAYTAYALDQTVKGLGTVFRYTYHLVAFAHQHFSKAPDAPMTKDDGAYQMARILRAQLSDDEILLIALNCLHGGGKDKFKPLVERYALLHNMRRSDIDQLGMREKFAAGAFGVTKKDQEEAGL